MRILLSVRKSLRNNTVKYEWAVPEGVDGEFVFLLAFAAMYGLEGRWLTNPESIDFIEEWARYEDYLFPLPQWEGCR